PGGEPVPAAGRVGGASPLLVPVAGELGEAVAQRGEVARLGLVRVPEPGQLVGDAVPFALGALAPRTRPYRLGAGRVPLVACGVAKRQGLIAGGARLVGYRRR